MEEKPAEEKVEKKNTPDQTAKGEKTAGDAPKESFLEKLKFKVPSFLFVQTLLIPATIIFLILLIGGGGTYLIASSVFTKNTPPASSTSRISESDIPQVPTVAVPTVVPPTPTTAPSPVPTLDISPTPMASPAAGWTPNNFTQLFLTFSYPPQWFVSVGGTSGPPYLTVRNFSGAARQNSQGQYSFLISRLEQVGITTISNLTTQLALNAASSTYINGVNMGQVTVISATPKTVNGYQALERTVSYSAFPTTNFYELYVLDGVSNVVKFMPQLDTTNGKSYFDTLISTIKFMR